jgi:hypothetical protein
VHEKPEPPGSSIRRQLPVSRTRWFVLAALLAVGAGAAFVIVNREQLFATNVALMYRGMRFGLNEAHGRGTAIQWNWFREKGAIVPTGDGRFRADFAKLPEAVKSLTTELLMIEATGDYNRGKALLDKYGRSNAEIEGVIAKLTDIPVDITPVFPAAGEN